MINNIKTKSEIRVIGLQRNGNHAIINWIIQQSGSNVLFFNDVEPENPFDESRLMGDKNNLSASNFDRVIYSYEDRLLNLITHKNYYPQKNMYNVNADKRIDLLILRNPFNSFASRMKHQAVSSQLSTYISGLSLPQLWITYANEYLGKSHYLKNLVTLNYDLWCCSVDYRKQIAGKLNIEFTDKGFKDITSFGQGSSFDSTKFDKKSTEMATDQRWKSFANDKKFTELFRDKMVIRLTRKIFGVSQELNDYIEQQISPNTSWKTGLKRILSIKLLPAIVTFARNSSAIRYIYISFFMPYRKRKVTKYR